MVTDCLLGICMRSKVEFLSVTSGAQCPAVCLQCTYCVYSMSIKGSLTGGATVCGLNPSSQLRSECDGLVGMLLDNCNKP